jgi:hypothetical protein
MKGFYLLFGLLIGLVIVIRISAITGFAITLSYVVMAIGALGLIALLILKPRA